MKITISKSQWEFIGKKNLKQSSKIPYVALAKNIANLFWKVKIDNPSVDIKENSQIILISNIKTYVPSTTLAQGIVNAYEKAVQQNGESFVWGPFVQDNPTIAKKALEKASKEKFVEWFLNLHPENWI